MVLGGNWRSLHCSFSRTAGNLYARNLETAAYIFMSKNKIMSLNQLKINGRFK